MGKKGRISKITGKGPTKSTEEEKIKRTEYGGLNRWFRKSEVKVNSHRVKPKQSNAEKKEKQFQGPIWGDGKMLENFQIHLCESKATKVKQNDERGEKMMKNHPCKCPEEGGGKNKKKGPHSENTVKWQGKNLQADPIRKHEVKVNSHRVTVKQMNEHKKKKQIQCPIWGNGKMLANFQIYLNESRYTKAEQSNERGEK